MNDRPSGRLAARSELHVSQSAVEREDPEGQYDTAHYEQPDSGPEPRSARTAFRPAPAMPSRRTAITQARPISPSPPRATITSPDQVHHENCM